MLGKGCEEFGMGIPLSGGREMAQWSLLASASGFNLVLAAPAPVKELTIVHAADGCAYVGLPINENDKGLPQMQVSEMWRKVRELFHPDVIHIQGCGSHWAADYVRTNGPAGVIISADDFVSGYVDFENEDSPMPRSRDEEWIIANVRHVLGCTEWDRAHILHLNPTLRYGRCGRTLRQQFYGPSWDYSRCTPHTVFVSRGDTPSKGLHQLIRALPDIISEFSDTQVRVAGPSPFEGSLRHSPYSRQLRHEMKRNGVEDYIIFTGRLDADGMLAEYLAANVFVHPAAISNAPESLGEAMMLGVPSLATYAGGTPDICRDSPEMLYRYEDPVMLAFRIRDIFRQKSAAATPPPPLSFYSPDIQLSALADIYSRVALEEKNAAS